MNSAASPHRTVPGGNNDSQRWHQQCVCYWSNSAQPQIAQPLRIHATNNIYTLFEDVWCSHVASSRGGLHSLASWCTSETKKALWCTDGALRSNLCSDSPVRCVLWNCWLWKVCSTFPNLRVPRQEVFRFCGFGIWNQPFLFHVKALLHGVMLNSVRYKASLS